MNGYTFGFHPHTLNLETSCNIVYHQFIWNRMKCLDNLVQVSFKENLLLHNQKQQQQQQQLPLIWLCFLSFPAYLHLFLIMNKTCVQLGLATLHNSDQAANSRTLLPLYSDLATLNFSWQSTTSEKNVSFEWPLLQKSQSCWKCSLHLPQYSECLWLSPPQEKGSWYPLWWRAALLWKPQHKDVGMLPVNNKN